jgi:DNA-binding NtrC family response regulator
MKAHILIVEDEAILYGRLRHFLLKENYSIDKFCESFEDAIKFIHKKKPDIVLLDINLKGQKTGIDLGKILYEEYHIPFIYVTGSNDDETFYESLKTRHEHYFVKTKPNLDLKELLRVTQTALIKNKKQNPIISKIGVLGLVEYKKDINSTFRL